MIQIYFTDEAYRNCIMFVSGDTINDRILDSSDRNLFLWPRMIIQRGHARIWQYDLCKIYKDYHFP